MRQLAPHVSRAGKAAIRSLAPDPAGADDVWRVRSDDGIAAILRY